MMVPQLRRTAPRHYVFERISSVGIRSLRAGSIGPMAHEVNEMQKSDRTRPRVYVRGLHILQNLEQAIRRTPHAQRPTIEDMGINHRRADVRMA